MAGVTVCDGKFKESHLFLTTRVKFLNEVQPFFCIPNNGNTFIMG